MKNNINKIKNQWESYIKEKLIPLVGNTPEGNLYSKHLTNFKEPTMVPKQNNIIKFLKEFKPNNVLEIGFNAGFSALLIKLINPEIDLTCIDINEHFYVVPCYKMISSNYKNIKIILESSLIALPKLIKQKKEFDVIHIDGDHRIEGAKKDLDFCLRLCRKGSVIIMDDTNLPHINELCNKYIKNKIVKEYNFKKFECSRYQHKFLEVM